jgi:hypothetical protein
MVKNMGIDDKILKEIGRYKQINNYLTEQEIPPAEDPALPPPPDAGIPPVDDAALPADPATATPPPAPVDTTPQPVDTATDPDVEKIGDEKEGKEELEITDLVKSQKTVEKKQEEYFDTLFKHLNDLENKLSDMDTIVNKLNDLEAKVEKYRPKSSQEKLELRSLDSGPFNQKLSDFFEDKREDFEKTGKEEYILTKDEVEDYSPSEIKKSFRDFEQGKDDIEDNFQKIR